MPAHLMTSSLLMWSPRDAYYDAEASLVEYITTHQNNTPVYAVSCLGYAYIIRVWHSHECSVQVTRLRFYLTSSICLKVVA